MEAQASLKSSIVPGHAVYGLLALISDFEYSVGESSFTFGRNDDGGSAGGSTSSYNTTTPTTTITLQSVHTVRDTCLSCKNFYAPVPELLTDYILAEVRLAAKLCFTEDLRAAKERRASTLAAVNETLTKFSKNGIKVLESYMSKDQDSSECIQLLMEEVVNLLKDEDDAMTPGTRRNTAIQRDRIPRKFSEVEEIANLTHNVSIFEYAKLASGSSSTDLDGDGQEEVRCRHLPSLETALCVVLACYLVRANKTIDYNSRELQMLQRILSGEVETIPTGCPVEPPVALRELQRVFQPPHAVSTVTLREASLYELQSDVVDKGFKPYRDPAASDERNLRGNLLTKKSPNNQSDDDDDNIEGKVGSKRREWDDWKDLHPRGAGSKMMNVG